MTRDDEATKALKALAILGAILGGLLILVSLLGWIWTEPHQSIWSRIAASGMVIIVGFFAPLGIRWVKEAF